MAGSPSKTTCNIKIKSPKSGIKIYKSNYGMPKMSSDLTIRGNLASQNLNEEFDKITQAWNKLKINALSKAISMSSEVGACSFKPRSCTPESDHGEEDLESTCEQLDLKNAVTSTPMKPKKAEASRDDTSAESKNKNSQLDISEIQANALESENSHGEELNEMETLRLKCLEKIELQIILSCQHKREELIRKWNENEEKIKEKLAAYKVELEKEQLLRVQNYYVETKNLVEETQVNIQLKTDQLSNHQISHEKKIAETNEKIRQIEERRKELEEKQKQKREELKMCITGIHEMQLAYNKTYNNISEITKKCKDRRRLNELVKEDLPKLKKMNELLLKLVEKCKESKVVVQDFKTAESLVQEISVMKDIFARKTEQVNHELEKAEEQRKKDLEEKELKAKKEETEQRQKAEEDAKKQQQAQEDAKKQQQAEEEAKRKQQAEEEAKRQQQAKESERQRRHSQKTEEPKNNLTDVLEDCISREDFKWYSELTKFLEDYENKLKPLISDSQFKNFRFDCQKLVNVPVNAISPLNNLHLEDKLEKLMKLLQGQPVIQPSNSFFYVSHHPLGVSFCTNLIAKKFVKQGELTVSSKPEAAFAIAAVIVALWSQFPEFGRLLLAHFHRSCPYLVPVFKPQLEGQTDQEYYKTLGYEYSEDGKVEPQDKFLRRMTGIMRLYAAIMVTPLNRKLAAEGRKHPHDIREGWRWLAASLNLSPRLDISPTLIYDFLEVAGYKMFQTYNSQFVKLLHLLVANYFPQLEQITPEGCSGPVVRLKVFLEKIFKEGKIAPPTGLLPSNFW